MDVTLINFIPSLQTHLRLRQCVSWFIEYFNSMDLSLLNTGPPAWLSVMKASPGAMFATE